MEKGTRKRRKKEGKGRKGWTKDEGGLRRSSPLSDSSLKTGLVERCGLRSKEESEERHSPVISLTHKLLAIPCLCWSQLGNVLPSLPLTSFPFPLFFSHLHSSLLHFFLKPILTTVGVSRKCVSFWKPTANRSIHAWQKFPSHTLRETVIIFDMNRQLRTSDSHRRDRIIVDREGTSREVYQKVYGNETSSSLP